MRHRDSALKSGDASPQSRPAHSLRFVASLRRCAVAPLREIQLFSELRFAFFLIRAHPCLSVVPFLPFVAVSRETWLRLRRAV